MAEQNESPEVKAQGHSATCAKIVKLSIIQPRIDQFHSNFVQTLIA